jgi:transcriptional regulator with XRE-family HTH domain
MVRRQLGRRLRQLRGVSGMSVDEVVAERYLGISRAKLFKLEAGKHAVKPQDIAVLCARYGVSPEETETLQALALATQDASVRRRRRPGVVQPLRGTRTGRDQHSQV